MLMELDNFPYSNLEYTYKRVQRYLNRLLLNKKLHFRGIFLSTRKTTIVSEQDNASSSQEEGILSQLVFQVSYI